MKGLSLSGGSTKIAGIAGAAIEICKRHNYKPDYITGISAGAILAVPLALGLYDDIRYITQNLTLSDVFSIKPVTKKGKVSFRGIMRLIRGKESLGEQCNLTETIKKVVTKDLFDKYKRGDFAKVYIGATDMSTGIMKYYNIKSMSYNEYLKVVNASASIPFFTESVKIQNFGRQPYHLMDGGLRDSIGSHWLMRNKNIKEHISVYSRPEKWALQHWKPSNAVSSLMRSMEILNLNKSHDDEYCENHVAKSKKILTKQVFLDIVESINYNMDKQELKKWFDDGTVSAYKVMLEDWRKPGDIKIKLKGYDPID